MSGKEIFKLRSEDGVRVKDWYGYWWVAKECSRESRKHMRMRGPRGKKEHDVIEETQFFHSFWHRVQREINVGWA